MIVGIFSDEEIKKNHSNKNFPILDFYSRVKNVLSIKYVDDIILNPPTIVNHTFISANKINKVIVGKRNYLKKLENIEFEKVNCEIVTLDSSVKCDIETFIKRINENWEYFKNKVDQKMEKLKNYYKNLH